MIGQFVRFQYYIAFLFIIVLSLESNQLPVHAVKGDDSFVQIPATEFEELLEKNAKGALLVFTCELQHEIKHSCMIQNVPLKLRVTKS